MNTTMSTYSTNINLNTLFIKRTYIFNLFYKSSNYLLFFFYNNIWFLFSPLTTFNNFVNNIFLTDLYNTKIKNTFFSKQLKTYKQYQFLSYRSFKYTPFFYKKLLHFPNLNKNVQKKRINKINYTLHPSFITFYSKLYQHSKLRIVTPMLKAEQFNFLPLPTMPFKSFFKSNNFYTSINIQKRLKFLDLITNLTKKIKITSLNCESLENLAQFAKLTYSSNSNKLSHLLPRQNIFLNPKSRLNFLHNKPSRDLLLSYILSVYKKGLTKSEIDLIYPFAFIENSNDLWNHYSSYTRSLLNVSFLFARKMKNRSKLEQPSLPNPADVTQLFHYKIDLQNRLFLKKQFIDVSNSHLNLHVSKIIKQLDSQSFSANPTILNQDKVFKKLKKNYDYLNSDYLKMYNLLIKRISIPIYTAFNLSTFSKLTTLKYHNIFRYWSLLARRLNISHALHTSNKQGGISKKIITSFLKWETNNSNLSELNFQKTLNSSHTTNTDIPSINHPYLRLLFKTKNKRKLSSQMGLYKWNTRNFINTSKRFSLILNSKKETPFSNISAPLYFTIWDNFKRFSNYSKFPKDLISFFDLQIHSKDKINFRISAQPFSIIKFTKTQEILEKDISTKVSEVTLFKKKTKSSKPKTLTKIFTSWESTMLNSCQYRIFKQNQSQTSQLPVCDIFTSKKLLEPNVSYNLKTFFLWKIIKNLAFKEFDIVSKRIKFRSALNLVNSLNTNLYPFPQIENYEFLNTQKLNYTYLKDLNFIKQIPIKTLINVFSTKQISKFSTITTDSEDYHLFSKYSRSFISLSTGFLFTNCNFLYHKQFQLDSLKVSHLNRQRYSFFYKNDIKRFYLNRSGNLTFLQNLDKDSFLRNKLLYNRLYLRKNHYTYDSLSSIFVKTLANTSSDPFFNKYNTQRKLINTFGLDDSTFTHQDLTPRLWEPRIKRIRFKPGYQRIWRKAREGINFTLKFNLKYQHRLTHRLAKLRFIKHKCTTRIYDLTLLKILLNTRFVYDLNSSKSLINNALVYVNGIVSLNPNLLLYVGDFIQIAISIKYYIVYRWLVNWNFNQRARLVKLSFYKNKVKHDLAKQKSNILPDWIFKIGSRQIDIPKYTEVDYFTLSVFIIYEPLSVNEFNPLLFLEDRSYILNMYNWKFIN